MVARSLETQPRGSQSRAPLPSTHGWRYEFFIYSNFWIYCKCSDHCSCLVWRCSRLSLYCLILPRHSPRAGRCWGDRLLQSVAGGLFHLKSCVIGLTILQSVKSVHAVSRGRINNILWNPQPDAPVTECKQTFHIGIQRPS